jgi:hypothetical protein
MFQEPTHSFIVPKLRSGASSSTEELSLDAARVRAAEAPLLVAAAEPEAAGGEEKE